MPRHRGPALVIDAAVAEHLEVLRRVTLRRLGIVERVQHAHALDGSLLHAVHGDGLREPRRLEDGRRHIDHMVKLERNSPLVLMPFGQCTIVPLRVPPQWEATCLVHW